MALRAGERLGPYEIVGLVGAGGMGEVYRARDPRLGREVAVKVLPASLATDSERLQRFEQEARAASMLNHPNILTVHDLGTQEGTLFLITELLQGESLREALRRGPLPLDRALDVARQIARGLAAAHERGIVHRDLKPENVFLTHEGTAKILDFGLAKLRPPEPRDEEAMLRGTTRIELTREGTVLGTVGYMAPEQVRGEPADTRSDLFAFGCVLYEMLAGERAFARPSAVETMHAILHDAPAAPALAGHEVAPAVEHLVAHCLEKRPADRFQNARDLLFALDEAASSASSQLTNPRIATRTRRGSRRVALLLGATAAAALLAILMVLVVRQRQRLADATAPIDSLAVLPLVNLSGDPQQEFFADGMTEALIGELVKLRALKVISRTSVMRFKGSQTPMPEIARELGVHGVVEGSVLSDGDQVRITVQLIDAPEDRHIWAESYTRSARDVLRLQGELARAIAREVRIAVSPEEARSLGDAAEVDPEAHRLLLQATELSRRGGTQLEDQQKIGALVDRALALAPGYAPVHVFRARGWIVRAGTGYAAGIAACPPARAELDRALELEPRSIAAKALQAWILIYCDYKWRDAERVQLELLDRAPGDASLHDNYGANLSLQGRHEEALAHGRKAFTLDPLNEWTGGHLLMYLKQARRFEEARELQAELLRLAPDSVFVKWLDGGTQIAMGDLDGALKTLLSRRIQHPGMNFMVGLVHGLAGRETEARKVLDYLLARRRQRYVPASQIAVVYGGLAERDAAFEWLDQAFGERDYFLADLLVDPRFDPLRGDPRLDALLAKMGLKTS